MGQSVIFHAYVTVSPFVLTTSKQWNIKQLLKWMRQPFLALMWTSLQDIMRKRQDVAQCDRWHLCLRIKNKHKNMPYIHRIFLKRYRGTLITFNHPWWNGSLHEWEQIPAYFIHSSLPKHYKVPGILVTFNKNLMNKLMNQCGKSFQMEELDVCGLRMKGSPLYTPLYF